MRSDLKDMKEDCSERKSVEAENEITPQSVSVRKPYPGVVQAIGIFILCFIIRIVIGLVTRIPADAVGISTVDQGLFCSLISIVVVLVFTYRKTNVPIREAFSLKAFNLMLVLPLVIAIIGISIISSEIDNVTRIFVPMPPEILDFLLKNALHDITQLQRIVFRVFLIPVAEEALFRGVILHGFLKRYSTKQAIIASALLFGVAPLNPWSLVLVVLGGIFLAWLLVYTKSLFACILAHMTMNAITLIVVSILGLRISGYSVMPTETVQFQPWWFDIMGVVITCVGIAGIIFLKRKSEGWKYADFKSSTVNLEKTYGSVVRFSIQFNYIF